MSGSDRVWTVLSMLEWATDYFEKKNVPDPRLSIEWILAEVLQCKRLDLYLQYERPLSSGELDCIRPLVKRRAALEPIQYIIGSTDFVNAKITVGPEVLIPRIETEQLVDILLGHFQDKRGDSIHLLDVGTGSGCIPIAVKKENPEWFCAGMEISEKALQRAKKNADINETDVHLFRFDIMEIDKLPKHIRKNWDIIISNPPYITEPEKKNLHQQVIEYEPHEALFNNNPMELYSRIIKFASDQQSHLYLECNEKFAGDIEKIAKEHFERTELLKDLDLNDRFLVASP